MNNTLPTFCYHPDPLSTGSVQVSDKRCRCCGRSRGYIYTADVYARDELHEEICPWCIADGSAAEKFAATFCDDYPLRQAGLPDKIVEEVTQRTPGYESWQGGEWLSCCGDACAFYGDAPREEVRSLGAEGLSKALTGWGWGIDDCEEVVDGYNPGGDPAIYKFVCRHCGRILYGMDYS